MFKLLTSCDQLYEKLKQNGIFGRRYFYPLISEFSMYKSLDSARPENLKTAKRIAEQVICLTIYPDLDIFLINRICKYLEKY
jgi:dTDP-4-amino-4,6-dideoxygalactose transaminase